MAARQFHFSEELQHMDTSPEAKAAKFGTTREEGDRYFEKCAAADRIKYAPMFNGTAKVAEEPTDALFSDLTALPLSVHLKDGSTYPLPLAILTEIINRSSHRVITRKCNCRYTWGCKSYDQSIGCLHIGAATAEEPESLSRHVSKEEAIEHARFAIESGLLPYVGRLEFDNRYWGIWSGEPIFTVCFCCPCCCMSRRGYTYLHPLNKSWKYHPLAGLRWKLDPTRCLGDDCSTCVRQCPARALKMVDGHLQYDKEKCILCGQCVSRCQGRAITIETDNLEAAINTLISRYDGLCGDLGFEGADYAQAVLKSTPKNA